MKKKFNIKYPKLLGFIAVIILAYFLFKNPSIKTFVLNLGNFKYIGIFIAGLMYSFGFSAPLSAGFFLSLNTDNILLMSVIGGIGAMLADLFIFRFIKISFMGEFNKLKREKISRKIKRMVSKLINKKARRIFTYLLAGILIASPLPDEAGVPLLAGLSRISEKALAIIAFVLNTLGIMLLLILSRS